ncbi:hypothetical protein Q1695_006000 [Nippostrongylus brasiliensis]|nr:hypothetical protein Q1695_006000 [Nippostrongylus brasiliensis]
MISERFHLRIKKEFLNRDANSRVDAFVELLIRAAEEISESIDVKDRRRFVNSAYRLTETHTRHKYAVEKYKGNTEMVVQAGQNSWQVYNSAGTEVFDVKWEAPCCCHPQINTHCLRCGVCAYEWLCTCLDNRSGISCAHRHYCRSKAHFCEGSGNYGRAEAGRNSVPESQHHQDESGPAFITVYTTDPDTDETIQALDEVDAYVDLANAALNAFEMGGLVPRREMTQPGGKPKLSKIPLDRVNILERSYLIQYTLEC